ncbi:hypothetical protein BD410DRAFT_789077 [Rickenella mellea]|uniref:Zn(2)-C6 fungal-type domain-containing protein n=1 Tax=Rickenella mellea TaxID=50990 RepID=A0A4Y7Q3X8_9AGAM|nr:hypothetical protein BD410DRAFT_789077 [Rickenella mellea]
MPVDTTGKEKRPSRRGGVEDRFREQEAKRTRGEIACAECNRLKLRCDKKIPCSSCVRRGCSAICPNSHLSGGQGTRFVLADTEQLHRKLVEMSERIRQLEDALAIETANSPTPHPLLHPDLLALRRGIEVFTPSPRKVSQDESAFEDFGTLTISEDGVSRFIGRTGGQEAYLIENCDLGFEPAETADASMSYGTTAAVPSLAVPQGDASRQNWPFRHSQIPANERLAEIEDRLPSWERGWTLCETYLEQSSWHSRFVRRTQLIDGLLTPIYKRHGLAPASALSPAESTSSNSSASTTPSGSSKISSQTSITSHDLALLLAVFAVAALADLTLPPYNDEAEKYYQLAKSIVSLETAAESPSVASVQALALMGTYSLLSDRPDSLERTFATMSFASILAASIGLHRDPAQWKLNAQMTYLRRHTFWQLFTTQNLQGLASGRPMIFALRYSDCQFPEDADPVTDDDETDDAKIDEGFWRWRYRFAKEIMYPINELTCAVGPVKYSDILELDRKLREMRVPKYMQIPPGGSDWERDGPYKVMQRLTGVLWRDLTMLWIHRSYFAKALLDYPLNPLKSPYATSFLSAYRSSLSLLKLAREHYDLSPNFMVRSWMLWKHVFSALMVLGTVVIRGPKTSLAPAALVELNLGVGFFENAARYSNWAKPAFNVLSRLREKAVATYAEHCTSPSKIPKEVATEQSASSHSTPGVMKPEDVWGDELAIFGGPPRHKSNSFSAACLAPETPSSPASSDSQGGASPCANPPLSALIEPVGSHSSFTFKPTPYTTTDAGPGLQTTTQPHMQSNAPSPFTLDIPSFDSNIIDQNLWTQRPQTFDPSRYKLSNSPSNGSAPPHVSSQLEAPTQLPQFASSMFTEPPARGVEGGSAMAVDLDEFAMSAVVDQGMGDAWSSFLQDSGLLNGAVDFNWS